MSDLILKQDGTPFATQEAAKSQRTRMGLAGLDTNIIVVDGGFALERKPYEKPKKRIPISTRNVLTVDKKDLDPDYKYRVVKDEGNRVRMFRDAGWEVVEKRGGLQIGDEQVGVSGQLGAVVTKSLGRNEVGYLMRIPKKYYEEDQQAKADKINEAESDLYLEQRKEGRYGKVKIER